MSHGAVKAGEKKAFSQSTSQDVHKYIKQGARFKEGTVWTTKESNASGKKSVMYGPWGTLLLDPKESAPGPSRDRPGNRPGNLQDPVGLYQTLSDTAWIFIHFSASPDRKFSKVENGPFSRAPTAG